MTRVVEEVMQRFDEESEREKDSTLAEEQEKEEE